MKHHVHMYTYRNCTHKKDSILGNSSAYNFNSSPHTWSVSGDGCRVMPSSKEEGKLSATVETGCDRDSNEMEELVREGCVVTASVLGLIVSGGGWKGLVWMTTKESSLL